MVAMLWRRVVIVINSDNYPGLTEMDSWPDKILLLELKKLKDLRNVTSTVSYGLKLSVELILYDLLTDLHLKQTN